jgi:tetratricopeptide (TPR) repeat protein
MGAPLNSVGERIREARQARGLTQAQLARGIVTKGFICQVERNRAMPSLPKLQIIADRLGLALDDLVGERRSADLTYLAKSAELAVKAGEPARAVELADQGMVLATSASERANLYRIRGTALDAMGDTDAALHAYQTAAATAPRDDLELNATIWVEIGTVLELREQFNAAIEANLRALDWLHRCRHAEPALRPRVLLNLSRLESTLGQADQAMDHAQQALVAATDSESLYRIANAHMALGILAREAGQLDRAVEHCNRALEMHRRIGQERIANRILNNLGDVHFAAGRVQEATDYQVRCLERARKMQDSMAVAVTASELARYALLDGDHESALGYAREGRQAARLAADHVREAVAGAYEARALFGLGRPAAGERLFRRSLRQLDERQGLAKLAHVCSLYSEVLRERGQVDRAFAFLRMASERDFKQLPDLLSMPTRE